MLSSSSMESRIDDLLSWEPAAAPYDISIFASDFVPGGSDADRVTAHMESLSNHIANIAEITSSEDRLAALRQRRETLENMLAIDKSLFAPIRRLFPELLSHVFSFYPLEHPGVLALPPWYLLRVCRRWKDVALRTPSLWAYIQSPHKKWNFDPVVVFPKQIALSGTVPLRIDIERSLPNPQCLDALSMEIGRIQSLRMNNVRYNDLSRIFPPGTRTSGEQLESVHVVVDSTHSPDPLIGLPGVVVAPHLRSLSVQGLLPLTLFDGYSCLSHLSISGNIWNPITVVRLPELCGVLRKCSAHLEELCISIVTSTQLVEVSDPEPSRIPLPRLRRLSVHGSPPGLYSLFSLLDVTDSLEELEIQDRTRGPRLNITEFLRVHNLHSLKSIEVEFGDVEGDDFTPVLALKRLQSMTLWYTRINVAFLAALTPAAGDDSPSWPCPSLTDLHLNYPVGESHADLVALVMERRKR